MDVTIRSEKCKFVVVYIDDIMLCSQIPQQHLSLKKMSSEVACGCKYNTEIEKLSLFASPMTILDTV